MLVAVKLKIKWFAHVSIIFMFSILSCFQECMKHMKEPKSNIFCTLFFQDREETAGSHISVVERTAG